MYLTLIYLKLLWRILLGFNLFTSVCAYFVSAYLFGIIMPLIYRCSYYFSGGYMFMSYGVYEYRLKEISFMLQKFQNRLNKEQKEALIFERNNILHDLKQAEDLPM